MKRIFILILSLFSAFVQAAQTTEEDMEIGMALMESGNTDSAFQHFLSAAEHGSPEGMYATAMMYATGQGVSKDMDKANTWWTKSAYLGFKKSYRHLGEIHLKEGNKDSAIFYLEQILEYDKSVYGILGKIYYDEDEVEPSFVLFSEGAQSGDPVSMYYLGEMYYDGNGVEYNKKEAVGWLRKSAKAGYQPAMEYLEDLGYSDMGEKEESNRKEKKKTQQEKNKKKRAKTPMRKTWRRARNSIT